jgi:hypothetical protein
MQIEHCDLLIAYGHLYLAWNEAAVPPPGECQTTTEIVDERDSDMGGGAVYHDNRVRVDKVSCVVSRATSTPARGALVEPRTRPSTASGRALL